MPFKTSIVLCTYNEANYIENTINALENNIKNLEIVIVDDFSTDGTVEILKKLNNKENYKIIFRQKSRSLASAFARGMVETTGDYVGWIDTNMSELAPKFVHCIKELEASTDLVLLSRYIDGGGDERVLLRAIASKYFNKFCRIIFNVKTKDLTSSIFLMKRTILDEVTILGYGHGEFFLEFLYNVHKKGYIVTEIPYVQKKDEDVSNSKSAPNLFKFFYHGFMYFLRILVTILRRKN
jgi:glycosyltransferase involved in cell wall biosynthesis